MNTTMWTALFSFYRRAQSGRKIACPAFQQWREMVLEDRRQFYCFAPLEGQRDLLRHDNRSIQIQDLGAGSRKSAPKQVADLARRSLSPAWQAQFLFRLINFHQPQTILELGTSLGISALYQHAAKRSAQMISIEGCPEIHAIAKKNARLFGASASLQLWQGSFAELLPSALKQLGQLDYAFIDGHHLRQPTLDYFEACLPYLGPNALLVFDDIYWSDQMQSAWEELKGHPKVSYSIDLGWAGCLFFGPRPQDWPQQLELLPFWAKPWS